MPLLVTFLACYNHSMSHNIEHLNSKFFDTFLTCNSTEFNQVVEAIYNDHFKSKKKGQRRVIIKHLRAIVANLIQRINDTPEGFIHYSRNHNFWSNLKHHMGNPLGLSDKIIQVFDTLEGASLITQIMGTIEPKMQTRVKAEPLFIETYLTPNNILHAPLKIHDDFPLVRVKTKRETYGIEQRNLKLTKSNQAKQMNKRLNKYNKLLEKHDIGLDYDFHVNKTRKRIYRVFNDNKLTIHGRFYGGFWISDIKSYMRQYITIDGQKTVELDYKAQHPHMLYANVTGKHLDSFQLDNPDPYIIKKSNTNQTYPRGLIKLSFMLAMNAKSREGAYKSLKEKYEDTIESSDASIEKKKEAKDHLKHISNKDDFNIFWKDFTSHHSPIASSFFNDWWKALQNLDACICDYVLSTMTDKEITVLSVHDSFIIQDTSESIDALDKAMKEAYKHINMTQALPPIVISRREQGNGDL